jgi:hypothetical protein
MNLMHQEMDVNSIFLKGVFIKKEKKRSFKE